MTSQGNPMHETWIQIAAQGQSCNVCDSNIYHLAPNLVLYLNHMLLKKLQQHSVSHIWGCGAFEGLKCFESTIQIFTSQFCWCNKTIFRVRIYIAMPCPEGINGSGYKMFVEWKLLRTTTNILQTVSHHTMRACMGSRADSYVTFSDFEATLQLAWRPKCEAASRMLARFVIEDGYWSLW